MFARIEVAMRPEFADPAVHGILRKIELAYPEIRREIMAAAPGAIEVPGRATAVAEAIAGLKQGDVLLIAGKGHETGQIVKGTVIPYSDHDAVEAALVPDEPDPLEQAAAVTVASATPATARSLATRVRLMRMGCLRYSIDPVIL